MSQKQKALVLGATGSVGRRFVERLHYHPWFKVAAVAASQRSAGKPYAEAVGKNWDGVMPIPEEVKNLTVFDVSDLSQVPGNISLVFSALEMPKEQICRLEEMYAQAGYPVVSNNSAHRWTPDIPMVVAEVNPDHFGLIKVQQKNRGWKKGFIVVKPNCSLQSFIIALHALRQFQPYEMIIHTMQAISGKAKTFETWPEMVGNVMPDIEGEAKKTENEPLKILGDFSGNEIVQLKNLIISSQTNRVGVLDGHMANVGIRFRKNPTEEDILSAWKTFSGVPQELGLPSAPSPVLIYLEEKGRPQPTLDRDAGNGMAITLGALEPGKLFDWHFTCLAHNTIRGAAGGAILTAELLKSQGYI